jgi:phosphoribosylformimino-5-aminoimidazole carboxamide ribotide isomerase
MKDFILYPAIDLRQGQVVRLKEGDPARLTAYSAEPAETARRWLNMGAGWLHVVNLDGAFGEGDVENRSALHAILELAAEFGAQVQFGGGLRSLEAIGGALEAGVRRVVIGTLAVEQPGVLSEALELFGADRVAVGIDARDGFVRVRGWQETSDISATDLACQMRTRGLRTVIFTDVGRDGTGRGLNIAATRAVAEASGLDVIASGGVHTLADVSAARAVGLSGVIVGRALYEGTLDLGSALKEVADAGKTDHPLS